jgi:hypothetical protein
VQVEKGSGKANHLAGRHTFRLGRLLAGIGALSAFFLLMLAVQPASSVSAAPGDVTFCHVTASGATTMTLPAAQVVDSSGKLLAVWGAQSYLGACQEQPQTNNPNNSGNDDDNECEFINGRWDDDCDDDDDECDFPNAASRGGNWDDDCDNDDDECEMNGQRRGGNDDCDNDDDDCDFGMNGFSRNGDDCDHHDDDDDCDFNGNNANFRGGDRDRCDDDDDHHDKDCDDRHDGRRGDHDKPWWCDDDKDRHDDDCDRHDGRFHDDDDCDKDVKLIDKDDNDVKEVVVVQQPAPVAPQVIVVPVPQQQPQVILQPAPEAPRQTVAGVTQRQSSGSGPIRPPSTGDGGLLAQDSGDSSYVGAFGLVAGLVTLGGLVVARRFSR